MMLENHVRQRPYLNTMQNGAAIDEPNANIDGSGF
jgi:hypothetical protein